MEKKELVVTLEIPHGVSVIKEGTNLTVKGPKGALNKNFDNPGVTIEVTGNELKLKAESSSKKYKSSSDKSIIFFLRNSALGLILDKFLSMTFTFLPDFINLSTKILPKKPLPPTTKCVFLLI